MTRRGEPTQRWPPVIDAAIRKGIKNIDESTFSQVYMYLRYGPLDEDGRLQPLPGSYKTYGLDEKQMAKAWKKYLRRKGYAQLNT